MLKKHNYLSLDHNTLKPTEVLKTTECALKEGDEQIECWIGTSNLRENGEFYKKLKTKADKNNAVFLASVDNSFVDMAVNMYETSFRKYNITNFLYVCSDVKAVDLLKVHGIDCFLYEQPTDNDHAKEYGSKAFILKMRVKMKMVTAALILGFTTVLTDLDVVFFKDPLPEMMRSKADITMMNDVMMDNCGFYIAHPTKGGVELHKKTLRMCMTNIIADQDAIASVMRDMRKQKELMKANFDKEKFACGLVYFENGKRMFSADNPCSSDKCDVSVVHNNWIIGKPAKIYRFKETGLWQYDDKGYYSNPATKYLAYKNPVDFGKESRSKERAALVTAMTLGKILNRTVILPKFHCYGKRVNDRCSFLTHFHISSFDKHFKDEYRENSFLQNPLVPRSTKKSVSREIVIKTSQLKDKYNPSTNESFVFSATDYEAGTVTKKEILKWFTSEEFQTVSILNFHSLYFDIKDVEKEWVHKVTTSLRYSTYRQYRVTG